MNETYPVWDEATYCYEDLNFWEDPSAVVALWVSCFIVFAIFGSSIFICLAKNLKRKCCCQNSLFTKPQSNSQFLIIWYNNSQVTMCPERGFSLILGGNIFLWLRCFVIFLPCHTIDTSFIEVMHMSSPNNETEQDYGM